MHAGTAEVTALMWIGTKDRKPPPFYEYEMRIACIFRITPPFRHEADIREREWLNKTVLLLRLDMAAAIRALLALWSSNPISASALKRTGRSTHSTRNVAMVDRGQNTLLH